MTKDYKTSVGMLVPEDYVQILKDKCLGLGLIYRGKINISGLINQAITEATPESIGAWVTSGLKNPASTSPEYKTNVQLSIMNYEKINNWANHLGVSQAVFLRMAVIAIVTGVWKHE